LKVSIAVDNINKRYGRGKTAAVPVEAEKTACRGVALTKRVGWSGYALTHVNSGRAIINDDSDMSKARLLKIADKLAKVEFNFAAYKTVDEFRKAFSAADPKVKQKLSGIIHGKPKKEKQ
jgi:hypothetical protein